MSCPDKLSRSGSAFSHPPDALLAARTYRRSMSSTPSLELAVQTSGLGKRFGSPAALDGVDLEVPRGVAFGFLRRERRR